MLEGCSADCRRFSSKDSVWVYVEWYAVDRSVCILYRMRVMFEFADYLTNDRDVPAALFTYVALVPLFPLHVINTDA
jgi:hypothetical protein